jgi:pilus assembly protein CpaC
MLSLATRKGMTQETTEETQTLHVLVGKSVIINTEARLRRVLVSNPAVAEASTVSPTQVVLTAKAAGSSSLILWDETGRSRMLDVLVDVDVSQLRDAVQQAFPSEPVQVQTEQGRIVVSGVVSGQPVIDSVLRMASVFSDRVVNSLTLTPPPHDRQILLQVRFAEVDRTKLDALGVNLFSTGATNTLGAISTQQFNPPLLTAPTGAATVTLTDLLNIFLFRPDLNLGATIRDLQQKSVLQILAEPNLLAMNGKPATFLAGGEFPFPVVQGTATGSSVTIQFRPFGVKLDFTGTITPNDTIRLKVAPEVSTLDFTNALQISGFLIPAISTRRAETEIELKDGQTFGIAGLLDHRTQAQLNKIPGIGDIPILGLLFRSKNIQQSRTELLVLVTPRIADPVNQELPVPASPVPPVRELDTPKFDRGMPNGG